MPALCRGTAARQRACLPACLLACLLATGYHILHALLPAGPYRFSSRPVPCLNPLASHCMPSSESATQACAAPQKNGWSAYLSGMFKFLAGCHANRKGCRKGATQLSAFAVPCPDGTEAYRCWKGFLDKNKDECAAVDEMTGRCMANGERNEEWKHESWHRYPSRQPAHVWLPQHHVAIRRGRIHGR